MSPAMVQTTIPVLIIAVCVAACVAMFLATRNRSVQDPVPAVSSNRDTSS